jgi:hypothetical protein
VRLTGFRRLRDARAISEPGRQPLAKILEQARAIGRIN